MVPPVECQVRVGAAAAASANDWAPISLRSSPISTWLSTLNVATAYGSA